MKNHNDMTNVLGGAVSPKTMVFKWALEFKRDRTSIEDDPQSGRSKCATTLDIFIQAHTRRWKTIDLERG